MQTPDPSRTRLEQAFQQYVDLFRSDDAPSVDEFLAEQPADLREPLRRMLDDFMTLRDAFGGASVPLDSGRVLGDFRLKRELGRGGMAVVWEAQQLSMKRRVALKLLFPHLAPSPKAIERFQREAVAGGRLAHPGIVQVHAVGETEGTHFLAQELIEGGLTLADSLEDLRRHKEVPDSYYSGVAELFLQIAEALAYAHDQGVMHRDVKPSNILLVDGDRPKVADFGLAKLSDDLVHSRTGELAGTPFYMSPEQAAGKRIGIDYRTDVFSLGASLYEALTLRRPFEGDTTQQVLAQILLVDPPDPRTIRSKVPQDLAVICSKALEKRAEDRYASMHAMAEDLRRHIEHRPILARPPGPLRRAQKWCLRHPTRSAIVGVGSAALAVILGLWIQNERTTKLARKSQSEAEVLHDLGALALLQEQADDLWPARPETVPAYERWLPVARELAGKVDQHRETLALLRERAKSSSGDSWSFATPEEHRFHDSCAELVRRLAELGSSDGSGLLADVADRYELARTVEELTVTGPEAREAWTSALASIGDRDQCPLYEGLELRPQIGLLPLRRNAETGLWEFWMPSTGERPEVDPNTDRLLVDEGTSLTFVLVPGDPTFMLGSDDPYQDPMRNHCMVNLLPFFVSKYEVTQGQWMRAMGDNPSRHKDQSSELQYHVFPYTGAHPVESVSFGDGQRLGRVLGLRLPTEAQWEYAGRAGVRARSWFGDDAEDAEGRENLLDASNPDLGLRNHEPWDDGYIFHAPVGSMAPNPFGLYDVHGNVTEWCRDTVLRGEFGPDRSTPGDGLGSETGNLVSTRGGAWSTTALGSGFIYSRFAREPYSRDPSLGLRLVRPVE